MRIASYPQQALPGMPGSKMGAESRGGIQSFQRSCRVVAAMLARVLPVRSAWWPPCCRVVVAMVPLGCGYVVALRAQATGVLYRSEPGHILPRVWHEPQHCSCCASRWQR